VLLRFGLGTHKAVLEEFPGFKSSTLVEMKPTGSCLGIPPRIEEVDSIGPSLLRVHKEIWPT
jgi:hypothetical protein